MTQSDTLSGHTIANKRHDAIRLWLLRRPARKSAIDPLSTILKDASDVVLPYSSDLDLHPAAASGNAPSVHHSPPEIYTFCKEDLDYVTRLDCRLPHWDLLGASYFITFCLADRRQRYLKNPQIADLTQNALLFGHGKDYCLDAFVIMPDHVHVLLTLFQELNVYGCMRNLKRFIAREANKINGTSGHFWQHEHLDHLVRNSGYWVKYFDYIHNNPVKAHLAAAAELYPYSSLHVFYNTASI